MDSNAVALCDTCHEAPATLESDAGPWMWCTEDCAKKFFLAQAQASMPVAAAGDGGDQESALQFAKLKTELTKKRGSLDPTRAEFGRVFPVGNYPYKVMGYNRAKQKILFLNKDRSVAVASLFSHQRLNRDFRGPWTGMRGGIIKAPTGAGKTATVHSILANYSRELVQLRTPEKFYFKPEADRNVPSPEINWDNPRSSNVERMRAELKSRGVSDNVLKKMTRPDLAAKLWQTQDDHVHRVLIYVTKTELVADVRKDFWAQKDRSQAAYTQLLKDNKIKYSNRFAPFRQDVHVMSYKQFDNMLRGKNAAGRNFWAGFDIGHGAKFEQVALDLQDVPAPAEIIVPVAYWRDENGWRRGSRTHAIEAVLSGSLKLSVEFTAFTTFYPWQLDELAKKLMDVIGNAAPSNKDLKRGKHTIAGLSSLPPNLNSRGSRGRTINRVRLVVEVSEWTDNNAPSADQWAEFVRTVGTKLTPAVKEYLGSQKLGRIEKPKVDAIIPESPANAPVGWRLSNVGSADKPVYRWERSAEGDYDYNPVDRLTVAFDEAHLMFNPEKLLAQESADADMIISALQQSEGAVAFFTSATIDMLDGLKMSSALTYEKDLAASKIPKFEKDEEDVMSLLTEVDRNRNVLANELRGRIGVTTVKGMRDLFPEQEYLDPLYYDISQKHAENIKKSLPLTVKSLMNAININTGFSEAYDISLDSYDPDRTLKELLPQSFAFGHSAQDIVSSDFPLGRLLLEQLRRADTAEAERHGPTSLTGRGIVTSSPRDDTVRAVAAILQAVGYQWYYLVEKDQTWEQRSKLNKAKSRGEAVQDEWRSVKWTERPYDRRATDDTLQGMGLNDFKALDSIVDGESVPPKFVVLSNALLVKQFGESVNLDSHESFGEYVLRTRNFTLPYRLLNLRQLKNADVADTTLTILRDASSKPVLHYFPATKEAADHAEAQYRDKPELASVFEDAPRAFFFIERANPQRFEKIELPLVMDQFDSNALEDIAFKSATVQANARSDAKEMILALFNDSIEEMRRINLRYILLGRAYGQGFDVFNVTQVFNTEPAPDRATEVQRRGRFARPGSHSGLPYERWVVQYRTLVARYSPDDAVSIRSMEDFADQLIASESIGAYAVVDTIERDPVDAAQNTPRLIDNVRLHPYQAVRIKIEDPSITLKRLQLERVFDSWAIDSEHNRVIADSNENPVHSPTNYIISASFVVEHFRTAGAALTNVDIPNEETIRAQLIQDRPSEFSAANAAMMAGDFSKMTRLQSEIQEDVVRITAEFSEPAAKKAEIQSRIDIFKTIEQSSRDTVLTIERRLARDESRRALFVRFKDRLWALDFTAFAPDEPPIAATALLRELVRRGFAQFDPRFERPLLEEQPTTPKRADPDPGEEAATTQEAKKQKENETDAELDMFELISSAHSLPQVLVGAASDPEEASEFVSFGTIVEKTAFADQEQQSIERDVLGRFRKLASVLGYWEPSIPKSKAAWPKGSYQSYANSIYEKIGGGSTTARNPTALKNAILELHKYGIMNWNVALEQIAHAVHSEPDENLPQKGRTGANERYLQGVAEDIGRLYSVATRKDNTVAGLNKLVKAFGSSATIESARDRSNLIMLCARVTASVRYEHTLEELAKFVKALRKRYRIIMKKDAASSILRHLAQAADALDRSEDPSTFALFGKLMLLKEIKVKDIKPADLLGYLQNLQAKMTAPSGTLKATTAGAVYARSNRRLQKLNDLYAFLSNSEWQPQLRKKVSRRTVIEELLPLASEKGWPLIQYMSAITDRVGTTDGDILIDHFAEILRKVSEYTDAAVSERIAALKPDARPTALDYQTGGTPAESYPVTSSKGGQLYYEIDDALRSIPKESYAELFRNGFESDAFPRLRFIADKYKNQKPDLSVISDVVSALKESERTAGLTEEFWTAMQQPAAFQVIATAKDDHVFAALETLDLPRLTSVLFINLLKRREDDLTAYLSTLNRIVRSLQSTKTPTALLVKLEIDSNPNYSVLAVESLALKLWRSDAEAFATASAKLEVLATALGRKPGKPLQKEVLQTALTVQPGEDLFRAHFDAMQAKKLQDFVAEMAALDAPQPDDASIESAIITPTVKCASCESAITTDIFECECESVSYCGTACQTNDWPLHSKFCRAVRVTSGQQTETS